MKGSVIKGCLKIQSDHLKSLQKRRLQGELLTEQPIEKVPKISDNEPKPKISLSQDEAIYEDRLKKELQGSFSEKEIHQILSESPKPESNELEDSFSANDTNKAES